MCIFISQVHIGNFYEEIGYINYKAFPLRLVLGLVLGIGFTLIAGIIVLVVCFSRKRRRLAMLYRKTPPQLQDLEDKHVRAHGNSYSENNPGGAEAVPLKSARSQTKDLDYDDVFEEDVDIKGITLFYYLF